MSVSMAAAAEPAVGAVVVVVGAVVVVVGAVVEVVVVVRAGGAWWSPAALRAQADSPAARRTETAITAHNSQLGLRRSGGSSGAGAVGWGAFGTTSVRPS